MSLTPEQQLSIVSKAWGKQRGFAFFPFISGKATCREDRIRSFEEGPAFMWPRDKEKVVRWMKAHANDELYWCPSLFEKARRRMEVAMDEHALWADLDEVDPRKIEDYPPTVAWETSPGRYQALWLLSMGDLQGASWQGGENQRLTYHLGADVGGWDTTQLLRFPCWPNHKPEHRGGTRDGPNHPDDLEEPKVGKLLWRSGRRYLPDEFEELPEIPKASAFEDILEDQIEAVDAKAVWGKVRLKVSKRIRELHAMREADPSVSAEGRSGVLWEMARELADAGCTAIEIVAVVRSTVWNKYEGRADELKRLTIEAGRAIEARSSDKELEIQRDREEKPRPVPLADALRSVRPPKWLIEGVWTEGACGFVAGQPKSFKTWCALDMALSVASGQPFLDAFRVVRPGPVLYVQEEDGLPMVKARYDKMWPGKRSDRMVVEEGKVVWAPAKDMEEPAVAACIGYGFVLSDPGWQAWLDEVLEEGYGPDHQPYRMVLLDPLMMIAGDVEENRAQEMTERLFKPIKQLSRKHDVAVPIVHHMRKSNGQGPPVRGGQMMLGSVANHAWAEDALYVRLTKGGVHVELESKSAPSSHFDVRNLRNKEWAPRPGPLRSAVDVDDEDDVEEGQGRRGSSGSRPRGAQRSKTRRDSPAVEGLRTLGEGSHSVAEVSGALGDRVSRSGLHQQLNRAVEKGLATVERLPGESQRWSLA